MSLLIRCNSYHPIDLGDCCLNQDILGVVFMIAAAYFNYYSLAIWPQHQQAGLQALCFPSAEMAQDKGFG